MSFDLEQFSAFIGGLELQYFQPHEFLVKCNIPPNTFPDEGLWPNIATTARLLDALRGHIGSPIYITSCYRSDAYNKQVGGTEKSQHKRFCAADIYSAVSPDTLFRTLKHWRENGVFKGGIGLYRTFVHVDTRGRNKTW